jgi:poly-beta-1,6-N-acetyl-D-glucosamine synthase
MKGVQLAVLLLAAAAGIPSSLHATTIAVKAPNWTRGQLLTLTVDHVVRTVFAGALSFSFDNSPKLIDLFCVDMFAYVYLNETFEVKQRTPALTDRTGRAAWLYSNYASFVTTPLAGSAFQLALWDIIHDGGDGLETGRIRLTPVLPAEVAAQAVWYIDASSGKSSTAATLWQSANTSLHRQLQIGSVPEPSTWLMIAIGSGLLLIIRFRTFYLGAFDEVRTVYRSVVPKVSPQGGKRIDHFPGLINYKHGERSAEVSQLILRAKHVMQLLAIGILFTSLFGLLYVMVGYPLLLALTARRGKAIKKHWSPRTVSIIVPVRNGELYLRSKLDCLLALDYPKELLEIIVVSDGSTDQTNAIAAEYSDRGVQLLRQPAQGKPAALNLAVPRAEGEIIFLTDVRQQVDAGSLRAMIACFADPTVAVVSGHLKILKGETEDQQDIGVYWRYETWIRDNLSRLDSTFGATGPFYCVRKALVEPLPTDILLDDVYLPVSCILKGYRVIVEPQAIAFDYPTPLEVEFQRKVRTLAGNYQLFAKRPDLLSAGNRLRFHVASYKLGRLMMPFALMSTFAASFGLPRPAAQLFLTAQICFYSMAYFDRFVVRGSKVKKVTSPIRTFVVMMSAAALATTVFFRAPSAFWIVTSSKALPGVRDVKAA